MVIKHWTAPGTPRARRRLAAGLGLLCGATMMSGATTIPAARAAGEPSGAAEAAETWCPSPTPSYDQVGDLLRDLESASRRTSAKRGLRSEVGFRQKATSGATRSKDWDFVGDPSTGRSRWYSSSRSTDAFGFSEWEAFSEQIEDTVKHRHYRRMGAGPDTMKTWAALASLKKSEVWLRTTSSRKKSWPLGGYPFLYTSYANHVRTDLPVAAFTCDFSSGDPFDTITVVATAPSGSRTLKVDLLSNGGVFDGTPDGFTLSGGLATDPEWSASEEPLGHEDIAAPAGSVSPTTFRIAATRTLTRELRDYYVLPDARTVVAKASTHAKRVAALRVLAADRNKLFVRDTNEDGSLTLTSNPSNVTGGVRYAVRYGDHVGKVTFTVRGKKVITSTTLPRLP